MRMASVPKRLTIPMATMYQTQDSLSPVTPMIQVNTNCTVLPKIVPPSQRVGDRKA